MFTLTTCSCVTKFPAPLNWLYDKMAIPALAPPRVSVPSQESFLWPAIWQDCNILQEVKWLRDIPAPSIRGSRRPALGNTILPGLTQPWSLNVGVSLDMGSSICNSSIQSDSLPHLVGGHVIPSEPQEERDPDLQTHDCYFCPWWHIFWEQIRKCNCQ